MGMCASNSAFVGYPIALQLFGPAASVVLALCALVESLLIMPLSLASAEPHDRAQGRSVLLQSLRGLVKNPMIIGMGAGINFTALDAHLPALATTAIGLVASAASPVALFVIGGSLVGLQLDGQRTDIATVVIGKLILHPLAVFAALWLLPATDATLSSAAVLFAGMPMLSIYPVLSQKYGLVGCSAAAPLAASVCSIATITVLIALLHWMPGVGALMTRFHRQRIG